jgi:hypothetical protein
MKFFVPGAETAQEAEEVWAATRKFLSENMSAQPCDRRIRRLRYTHDGRAYDAEVGGHDNVEREVVIAIFDATSMYFVCTPNRGVVRGLPIMVGKPSVLDVEDFD